MDDFSPNNWDEFDCGFSAEIDSEYDKTYLDM